MSRTTTSGAWIGDLVVLFCIHSIPKRSHEKAVRYSKQERFYDSQNLMGVFFNPKRNARVNNSANEVTVTIQITTILTA